MNPVLFITGTDTDVGKTFVSAALLAFFRSHGIHAGYFKPVQSGSLISEGVLVSPDLLMVAKLTGFSFSTSEHSCYQLLAPMSPYQSAELEHIAIDFALILDQLERLKSQYDVVIVEGAGGLLTPLTKTHTILDLAILIGAPIAIVARPGLGTINHTLLTIRALRQSTLPILGFIINPWRESADLVSLNNPQIIEQFSGVPCLGHMGYVSDTKPLQDSLQLLNPEKMLQGPLK